VEGEWGGGGTLVAHVCVCVGGGTSSSVRAIIMRAISGFVGGGRAAQECEKGGLRWAGGWKARRRGCELAPKEAPEGLKLATFGGG